MTAQRNDGWDLAFTVTGASAGSLARHWLDPVWTNTLILAFCSAALIGFAVFAASRTPITTIMFAAGGAAGSISAAATGAASATPAQSAIGLAAFFAGVVAGLVLGMRLASFTAHRQHKERC